MIRIILTYLSLFFIFSSILMAEEPQKEEPKPEEEQQSSQEKAKTNFQKAQFTATEKYSKALDAEIEKASKSGNLDLVTEIQKEKESISGAETTTTDKDWKKVKSLALAAKNFNEDLKKARKSYMSSLEKIVIELTQQKKYDDAKEVSEILKTLKNEDIVKSFCGKWFDKKYKFTHEYFPDGTGKCGDATCTWKIEGDEIVATWPPDKGGIQHWKLPLKKKDMMMNGNVPFDKMDDK